MEKIAQSYQDQLPDIKKSVEQSRECNNKNNERFNSSKKFLFQSTIPDDNDCNVEVNVLEAYLSRLWGEFSKQVPELSSRATTDKVNPAQVDNIEGHLRSIFSGSDYETLANYVYKDTMSGGFSVLKVITEYENDESMDQVIRMERVFDPTLTGFDPLARQPAKDDGEFCYMLFPKYKKELEAEHPDIDFSRIKNGRTSGEGFEWSYKQNDEDVFYVCEFYKKKYHYVTLYQINDPENPYSTSTVTKEEYDDFMAQWMESGQIEAAAPQVLKKDKRRRTTITRYQFIGDTLLSRPEDTDYEFLPLIFVDGNSAYIDNNQMTRPYIYNAMDSQRIKNLSANQIVNELENTRETDVLIAKESIPAEPEYIDGWKDPQRTQAALVYDSKDEMGNPNPPPQIFPRSQMNPAFMQVFEVMDKTIQTILGSYDAQLGIQNNQLSGIAIVEGATQSNNAAMPYVINYLSSLNQVARVIMSLIPKYYKTARTMPVVTRDGKHEYVFVNGSDGENLIDFGKNDLEVVVKAGANFDVQRQKALITMTELMKASENFKALMETEGLPMLIDNVDIRGKDQLKQMAESFLKKQEEQKAAMKGKPNPQEEAMKAQIQIEQGKLQVQKQKMENDYAIKQQEVKQEYIKLLAEIDNDKTTTLLRLQESQNEADRTQAELAMKFYDKQASQIQNKINSMSGL
jgi:hypothetical protein